MVCTLSHYTHLIAHRWRRFFVLRGIESRRERWNFIIEKKEKFRSPNFSLLFSATTLHFSRHFCLLFFFGRFFIFLHRPDGDEILAQFFSFFILISFLHTRLAPLAAAHRPIINEFPPLRTLSNDWSHCDVPHGVDVRDFRPKLCWKLSTYIEKKRKKTPHNFNSFSLRSRIWTFFACGYIRNDRVGLRCERDRLVFFSSLFCWFEFYSVFG